MKNIFISLVFLLSTQAYGVGYPLEIGEITLLQIHSNPTNSEQSGQRYIVKLTSTASDNTCGMDYWTGFLNTDTGKAQYSAILSAVIAGKEIKLEGTPATCESNSLLIRNVYVVW